MEMFDKKLLSIEIGNNIFGINELFSALQAAFYFRFGKKCIPEKEFVGCPNATLAWALKASRLIINGSYVEREISIYGSNISIVFSLARKNQLKMDFIQNGKSIYKYTGVYIQTINTILNAAEKSYKISKDYEFKTMAEYAIEDEIRLMKKHIEKYKISET